MKNTIIGLILSFTCFTLFSQAPGGFNYQGVLMDSQGAALSEKSITLRINILQNEENVWTEDHSLITDKKGHFSVVIGEGDHSMNAGGSNLDQLNWSAGNMKMIILSDVGEGFTELGSSMIQSVPYALYAEQSGGEGAQDLSLENNILSLSGDPTPDDIDLSTILTGSSAWDSSGDSLSTFKYVGIGTSNPSRTSLAVQGLNNEAETPLFEVRREDGVPVFAVYNDGVMVYVDEDQKGPKGGFAVGGYNKNTKNEITQEYLRVTADSVRIYVPEEQQNKGAKGGFAVGGYNSQTKGISQDLLYVTSDSIRLYVPDKENDPGFVGLQGGFAVETFDPDATEQRQGEYIMGMNRGITRINTADNSEGFAVGSQGEGWGSTYLQVTPLNTFVGFETGKNTLNDQTSISGHGNMNVFMGYNAGKWNVYGHHNVLLGYKAGYKMVGDSIDDQNASYNVFVGSGAGWSMLNGSSNVFLGKNAGVNSDSLSNNIFIGVAAGSESKHSSDNILIGNNTAKNLRGSQNTIIGENAGSSLIDGAENVIIGASAGLNSTGSGNIFIGNKAGSDIAASNKLYIENSDGASPLIYGDFETDELQMNGRTSIDGDLSYTGSLVTISDKSVKEDIMSLEPVLSSLLKIEARNYALKNTNESKSGRAGSHSQYGFVAQELEQVFPELVVDLDFPTGIKRSASSESQDLKGVKYLEMIPLLLKGIQEQQVEIEALKARIVELESR